MRDSGLDRAIHAAGGVAELARRIGITQPSVSNWNRVPAERVIAVEAATGVSRIVLRPDLYSEPAVADDVDESMSARAQEYALLATLLSRAPSDALLAADCPAARRCDAARVARTPALAEAASIAIARRSRARIFRPVHRPRARRIVALRILSI